MLSDPLKQEIQQAYSKFLENKGLRPRHGQKLMIAHIARTLGGIDLDEEGARQGDKHVCVVEAGTGTGKTVAYLLSTLPLAKVLGKKVVISTATVALQEQIVFKDLPDVQRHSDLNFSFALAKGRSRYLCLSKLDNLLLEHEQVSPATIPATLALYPDEAPQAGVEEIKIYRSMVDALAGNRWDGDRDNWAEGVEPEVWSRVTTDHRQCTGRRCSNVGACSFFKAREDLGKVDCIVANHDLVLADLALGGGAILPAPEDTIYIFDEGHHLPDKTLSHFSYRSRTMSTIRWLEQCTKQLGQMSGQISGAGQVDRFMEQLPGVMASLKQQLEVLYPALQGFLDQVEPGNRRDAAPVYRFAQGRPPSTLMADSAELAKEFERLTEVLNKIIYEVEAALDEPHSPVPKVDLENWYPVVGGWQARAQANYGLWSSYATADTISNTASNSKPADEKGSREIDRPPRARWLSLVDQQASLDIEVCSSPVLAADTLTAQLWERCYGAVVTSATLRALGLFDRFCMRAGTPVNSTYEAVPSPFDYSSAVIQIPPGTVDAGQAQEHTQALVEQLPGLLNDNKGALVLFASRRQMLDVYQGLGESWCTRVLLQGEYSKQELLRRHRESVDKGLDSVIFGLASFAEGVDLPGEYCTHVVIAKIPFAVPDDPVEAALAEWVESKGGNPFMEITVPDAAIKLVQASGRLLRTEQDRGSISLLDSRLLTRRYGKALLNSLPPYQRKFDL